MLSSPLRNCYPSPTPSLAQSQGGQGSERWTTIIARGGVAGFIDGLTIPVALTVGLSFLTTAKFLLTIGLGALVAGAVATSLETFLTARIDQKRYDEGRSTMRQRTIAAIAGEGRRLGVIGGVEMVGEILGRYGVGHGPCKGVVEDLRRDEVLWVQFMMDFESRLARPKMGIACVEGLVRGLAYFLGGLLPMIPYFPMKRIEVALFVSIGAAGVLRIIAGYAKQIANGCSRRIAAWDALQTLVVGAATAAASYGAMRGLHSSSLQ